METAGNSTTLVKSFSFSPVQALIITNDGFTIGGLGITVQVIGILTFMSVMVFVIYNIYKFYRHRSYILGLFYLFCIMNLLLRAGYFVADFYFQTSYWNVIFLCWPASMSCSLGLCQVMNYVVLYIRLVSYV